MKNILFLIFVTMVMCNCVIIGNKTDRQYGEYDGMVFDSDGDNIPDFEDNCPFVRNKWQEYRSKSSVLGMACDESEVITMNGGISRKHNIVIIDNYPDFDRDGWDDETDNCPFVFNPKQIDEDNDGDGDACEIYWGIDIFSISGFTNYHSEKIYVDGYYRKDGTYVRGYSRRK